MQERQEWQTGRWTRVMVALVLLMLANSAYLVVVRRIPTPPRTEIATMAPSKSMFSLALNVRVRRGQRARVGLVSCMLHHRRNLWHSSVDLA